MSTLILSQADVRRLLPMSTCIDLMDTAFRTLATDRAVNPLRNGMLLPNKVGLLGMMPGYTAEPEAMGLKVVSVFPGNHGTAYDSHQGVVILFEMKHGTPVAILDASEITAIRTAAASGAATRLLAREGASVLAMIGSGVQAHSHLEAMLAVRPITMVRVYSPTREHRESFAELQSQRHNIPIDAVPSAEEAVRDADIICTTTSSREPVVQGAWIAEGAHINAVGSSVRSARELDNDAVVRARLYVDRRESTINEAGDYLTPLREGAITEEHIVAEIGDVLLERAEGRRSDREITLFKSLGVAAEDLVAADYVFREATKAGLGTEVFIGGRR